MGDFAPPGAIGGFHYNSDNAIALEGYRQTWSIKTAQWDFHLLAQVTVQVSVHGVHLREATSST